MIIPPLAAPEDFTTSLLFPDTKEGLWFIFSKDKLLISRDGKSLPHNHDFTLQRTLYLGTLRNKHVFAGELKNENNIPPKWQWSDLKPLYSILDEENYAMAGRALQLIHWDRTTQFCGCCGGSTFHRQNERCRECKTCRQLFYPKLSPVAMALVKKEEKILLARSPHFPGKTYSVLAGFVDPGETLEQCVARKVYEEVGIKVQNIQYFHSQPWPFSHSLIIGFTCDWLEGDIKIDPLEIEAADWFDASNLPDLPPQLSLAYMLINAHTFLKN
ncbi:MAG: NAD(+) diphosphatase [Chlamydiae bacterium CG10_big_fil_rev_8_21_14_0_10_35_9]|nr:MAG: NAD(+) diphosphatase [Chlamydiae bacterium CG10_big_fil_rev_8_21_14_0_10_35_9]